MKKPIAALLALMAAACAGAPPGTTPAIDPGSGAALDRAIQGPHRTPAFRERDRYRHPKETLEFFGLRPDLTVVEVWPGAGWYTEILAPYLREHGTLYAAGFVKDASAPAYRRRLNAEFAQKLAAQPDLYDRVIVAEIGKPAHWAPCPPGAADLVLTFRNVHNWISADYEADMFRAFHAALKPGGVLGVVEHRARPGTSREDMKKSGYVTEDHVIELAQAAGFRLDAKSEINANPRDTREHPAGVWTLPPTLELQDQDREKYVSIGESDRMTLRFVKR